MSNDNQIWIIAEQYLAGTMPDADITALHQRIDSDPAFAADFHESVNLLRSLNGSGRHAQMRSMLTDIAQHQQAELPPAKRIISFKPHYLRTAAVAAGVALITSFSTYWAVKSADKTNNSEYNLMRRDLENIKRSQSQLIKDINKRPTPPPPSPVRSTGTGFAVTNDGYLVTNYHVIDAADSVYIQDHDGEYFKASVVETDPANDLAILKVNSDDFRFGKTEIPYSLAGNKASLGSRVYTLGFPEDDIVYNEGYIRSRNGYRDDSMQYSFDLPAEHGQSGSPILDANGNVLAILTSVGKQGEGITYGVSSRALIQLLHALPKSNNIHLPKSSKLGHLSREEQISKIEDYTCCIKVYKK